MHKFQRLYLAVGVIALAAFFAVAPGAQAATFHMPAQTDCDNGSTTLTWEGEGVARPVIASMMVDGTAVADPANPELNSLGAVVCPSTTKGNRTSLSVIWRTAEGNTADLTDALTPTGAPVTADTDFVITLNDLGTNAANYTFALVYGSIGSWSTSNLGTATAAISFTVSPVRTPFASGNSTGFEGCTAVPPTCNALKSDEDVLGASMAMSFEPGVGTNMIGSYFALTGAMGGYVTSADNTDGTKRLVATIGAPHFLADGTTLNTGNMTAFLPTAVLASLFGLTGGEIDTSTLDVTRTSGNTTSGDVPFTIAAVAGGVTLTVPTITFSSPKYTIKMTSKGLAKKKTIASTPFKSKSSIKVIGKNVKANGTAKYKLEIIVRNKLGKAIKVTPTISSTPAATLGTLSYKAGKWTVTLATKKPGQKTVRVGAKGVPLKKLTLTFAKP